MFALWSCGSGKLPVLCSPLDLPSHFLSHITLYIYWWRFHCISLHRNVPNAHVFVAIHLPLVSTLGFYCVSTTKWYKVKACRNRQRSGQQLIKQPLSGSGDILSLSLVVPLRLGGRNNSKATSFYLLKGLKFTSSTITSALGTKNVLLQGSIVDLCAGQLIFSATLFFFFFFSKVKRLISEMKLLSLHSVPGCVLPPEHVRSPSRTPLIT